MKKLYTKFVIIFSICLGFASCTDYVQVDQKGVLIPKSASDYQYLLNSSTVFLPSYGANEYGTDDVDISGSEPGSFYSLIYSWAPTFFGDTQNDGDWNALYKQIYNANIVIEGLKDQAAKGDSQVNNVYGQALVHRAFCYWVLVNQYSKNYNAATAATDLGVPMKLLPTIDKDLTRGSVEQVYNLIITDVTQASELLPAKQSSNLFPSRCAAHALLARTYLFMGKYDMALQEANKALAIKSTVYDLRTASTPLPLWKDDPQTILAKQSTVAYYDVLKISDDVLGLFTPADLRYSLYLSDASTGYPSFEGKKYSRSSDNSEPYNVGIIVPEIILTKAECEARLENSPLNAMETLNSLRVYRFSEADFTTASATDNNDALTQILEERRRELLCGGMRWFDLKRLNETTNTQKTLTHQLDGTTFTLLPKSDNYVFPIAKSIIRLNPEIIQNPRN